MAAAILSQFSDTYPFLLDYATVDDTPDHRSSSPSSSSSSSAVSGGANEEVILASNRPKRRAGRRVFKETRHPVFRGVRQRNNGKWVCELREPNKKSRIWLGTYPTADMAARAHDVAALALRGKSACLNFADSAWRLPAPASACANNIRAAAAEAAEAFRPRENGAVSGCDGGGVVMEKGREETKTMFYVDEEALLDMPRFFADLAEGLLLPPPLNYFNSDDVEYNADASLWSYSF